MKQFFLGAFALVLLGAVGGVLIVAFGGYDIRASKPDPALVVWSVHRTMIDAVRRNAVSVGREPPIDGAAVTAGFALYDANCAECHGGPGVARAAWAAGMNPSPPFLLDAADNWRPRELKWIIANGVKMTGMPTWRINFTDAQQWDVVAFLRALPYITPESYARLRGAVRAVSPAAGRTPQSG